MHIFFLVETASISHFHGEHTKLSPYIHTYKLISSPSHISGRERKTPCRRQSRMGRQQTAARYHRRQQVMCCRRSITHPLSLGSHCWWSSIPRRRAELRISSLRWAVLYEGRSTWRGLTLKMLGFPLLSPGTATPSTPPSTLFVPASESRPLCSLLPSPFLAG